MRSPITDVVEKQTFREANVLMPNKYHILVNGLRDSAPLSNVKVFRANLDGTRGEFLRTEYH